MSGQQTTIDLFGGADPRCEILLQALKEVVYKRAIGLPLPSILGVLRILEHVILEEQGHG